MLVPFSAVLLRGTDDGQHSAGPSGTEQRRQNPSSDEDDRQYYYDILSIADDWVDRRERKVVGVHLIRTADPYQPEYTHFAMTYCWAHKYVIDLPPPYAPPGCGEIYEFALTFHFNGSFADFCRHAHLCDELAASLVRLPAGTQ